MNGRPSRGAAGGFTLIELLVTAAILALLAGGAMQTLLSVALWPVRRHLPEARALAGHAHRLDGGRLAALW